jgi:hypothetical protein
VRCRDGQRGLLLLAGAALGECPEPWPAGEHDLTFVCQLDSGDGVTPVLSRRGSSLPEAPPAVTVVLP